MNLTPGRKAAIALIVAAALLAGGLIGTGAVSPAFTDTLFDEDEPNVALEALDDQHAVENEDGELELDFTDPGLTRNARLDFYRVFNIANNEEETPVVVWVSHDNEDVLGLYDDDTGETIAGEANATALDPGERTAISVAVDSRGVTADDLTTTVTFSARVDIPFYEIEIAEIPDSVVAGQTIETDVRIENTGNSGGEETIQFRVDGEVVAEETVDLDVEERGSLRFEYETDDGDAGEDLEIVVEPERGERGESANATVAVEPAEESFFDVTIEEIDEEIHAGERLDVEATVENVGDVADEQTVELLVDGEVVDSRTLELDVGESKTTGLRWRTETGDAGEREIRVASEDDDDSATVIVNRVLNARPAANSYVVEIGATIEFDADRTVIPEDDPVERFEWDFGDGTTGEGGVLSHAYTEPGTYTVSLTAETESGETDTGTVEVEVQDNDPPSPEVDVGIGEYNETEGGWPVEFDASGTTDNVDDSEDLDYEWRFGDGSAGDGIGAEHVYDTPDRYTVELTVTDSSGNQAVATRRVTIESPFAGPLPDEIAFGDVSVGSTAGTSIDIENTGNEPLNLNDIGLDDETGGFELVGNAEDGQLTVEPGDTRSIGVRFTPDAAGIDETRIVFGDNDNPASIGPIELRGEGIEGNLEPTVSAVDFGTVSATESETETVTVENTGNDAIDLTAVEIGGDDDGAFSVIGGGATQSDPVTIDPGASHDIEIEFVPTAAGDRTANVRIADGDSTASVALQGEGQAPRIRVSPDNVSFGTVGIDSSESDSIEIRNRGSEELELGAIDLTGGGANAYRIESGPENTELAPGETVAFDLYFEPTETGTHTADLEFESNDPEAETFTVNVSGNAVGPNVGVDRETLHFGAIPEGESQTMTVTVENKQNSLADLVLDSTDIVGLNPDSFSVVGGGATEEDPVVLEAGEVHEIEVEFSPTEDGIKSAQLDIGTNGPTVKIWLSNSRSYIKFQEIGNPTLNLEGFNLLDSDEYDVDIRTETVDRETFGFQALQFRANDGTFEMNIEHNERRVDVDELDDNGEIHYVRLDHIDTDSDATFDDTGLRYQIRQTAVPNDVDVRDVPLYRWNEDDDEWVDLSEDAELVDTTDTHYVFEADTPGFSQFATSIPLPPDGPEDPDGTEPTDPDDPEEPADPEDSEEPTDPEDPDSQPDPSEIDTTEPSDIDVIEPDPDSPIQASVEFGDDGPSFSTREVSADEIAALDEATADLPPRALIHPRSGGTAPEADRTVTIDGEQITLSAEKTRITTTDERIELSGERSTVSSGEAITDRERMIGAVDIDVPDDRRNRPATVQFRVDLDRFGDSDPGEATIGHRTDDGWELLATEVIETTEDDVVLAAQTPSFSIFGVFADPQVEYEWTFPDGATAEGPVLGHTFEEPGLYEVGLTVSDAFGRISTADHAVLANDVPQATVDVVDREGEEVTLAAEIENEIGETEVEWTFPDGTQATGEEVTTTLEDGQHEIELRVVDEFGAESETTHTVALGPLGALAEAASETLGIQLELLVQIGLLAGVGLALGIGYRRVPFGALVPKRRGGPEITALEDPVVNADARRIAIGELAAEDSDRDLETVTVSVIDADGETVLRKTIDISGAARYAERPETLSVPPGVEIDPDGSYTIRAKATNSRGGSTEREVVAAPASGRAET